MATLLSLVHDGALSRIDPEIANEDRFIFTTPTFQKWVSEKLPQLASNWDLDEQPIEQFDGLLDTFCGGHPLTYGSDLRCLFEHENGIWELKTADLRIFGWFVQRDYFIAVRAGSAWFIKEHKLYKGFIGEVMRERDALDLDAPKFIEGKDPNVIVSNCYFA